MRRIYHFREERAQAEPIKVTMGLTDAPPRYPVTTNQDDSSIVAHPGNEFFIILSAQDACMETHRS